MTTECEDDHGDNLLSRSVPFRRAGGEHRLRQVRGRVEHELTVFRGIPFAQPPVGDARSATPRPPQKWSGEREAFLCGPPPPQEPAFSALTGLPDAPDGDDWLTINVWTPQPDPQERRPVLVWVYGGGFKLGYAGSPAYDAHRIASDGDLVVVTLNYRIGVEGFVHIDGAPDNRGLLDQVAALRWVQENIAFFGGDPDRVTVCGESAGAISVAALLAMPSAAGLFQRAILQSMPGKCFTPELAADIGTVIAQTAGREPTVADLSEVDPRKLPEAGSAVGSDMRRHAESWGTAAYLIAPFAPVIDGDTLPKTPWQAIADGDTRDIALLLGHNRDECRLFLALSGQLGRIDNAQASSDLRLFGPGPDAEHAYRTAYPDASPARLSEIVQSDNQFRMPTLHLAQAQAATGGRAYLYELTWPSPNNGGALGACHGLESPLLFGTYGAHLGPLLLGAQPPAATDELATRIRTEWTRFAATGDPGWPAFDHEHRLTRIFDRAASVAEYPEEASRKIWQHYAFGPLPLLKAK